MENWLKNCFVIFATKQHVKNGRMGWMDWMGIEYGYMKWNMDIWNIYSIYIWMDWVWNLDTSLGRMKYGAPMVPITKNKGRPKALRKAFKTS